TIGVSLLIAPFFFCALLFSKLFGFEVDGFSLPFQMSVHIAGIFYCIVGLIFIKKLLLQLNIKPTYVAVLIILACFGTHLFSYTVNEPGMAHVYAFALTSILFYLALNLFQKRTSKYFYLSAVILGLIVLVRPINIILLTFIPFFFQNRYDMFSSLKVILRSKHFYFALIVLIAICSIQDIAWFNQNGRIFQDPYYGNGFYFNNPQIFNMLFGFNNGLFIYVPICLVFLLGVIPIFIFNKFKGIVFLVSLAFVFYIFASYWAYNYFDGFGIRTFVDFLPIFIIGGAYSFQNLKPKMKYALSTLGILCLFMNLFYIYQYRSGIIKGNGMNYEKFSYVFLKSNKAYADSLGGSSDLQLYSKTGGKTVFVNENSNVEYDLNNKDTAVIFNYNLQLQRANGLYTLIEFERKEVNKNSSFNGIIVFNATDATGNIKNYHAIRLNETPSKNCCEWKKYSYSIASTAKLNKDDKLSMMILNPKKASFFIKNFNVKIIDYSYNI
ncbi:MAG: hypothetical protein ABIP51_21705, partial [Bacteroidia bacterium]